MELLIHFDLNSDEQVEAWLDLRSCDLLLQREDRSSTAQASPHAASGTVELKQ